MFYNGYKHKIESTDKITYEKNFYLDKEKTFVIIGEDLDRIKLMRFNYKNVTVNIVDSFKVLSSAQNTILKDYGFESKVDVDWNSINIYNLFENRHLIKERCDYDVRSMAKIYVSFLEEIKDNYDGEGVTAASISMSAFKKSLTEDFRDLFPILTREERVFSKTVNQGAVCGVAEKYAGKVLRNLQMLDINSSYPFSMTFPLPYGNPAPIQGFVEEGYSEYMVFIDFESDFFIPWLRCNSNKYCEVDQGIFDYNKKYPLRRDTFNVFKGFITINSIDLETLSKTAQIKKLVFVKGYNYKTKDFLRDFILKLYKEKSTSEGSRKRCAKLLLNSLYGKFSQDLTGITYHYEGVLSKEKTFGVDNEGVYQPVSNAILSYSRRTLINMITELKDDFVYCDTDSVFFLNPNENTRRLKDFIDPDELGKWGFEYHKIIKAKFLSKKNYILEIIKKPGSDISNKTACVGLNGKYSGLLTFENMYFGAPPLNITKLREIYGGITNTVTQFSIRER